MRDADYRYDSDKTGKLIFNVFMLFLIGITLLICFEAPGMNNFRDLYKINPWFGENWCYVDGRDDNKVMINSGNYLKLGANDGHVVIEKIIDFTPQDNEYLMFSLRAFTVNVYVNDELVYEMQFMRSTVII